METLERTPAQYDALLDEAHPEEVQQALQHAHTIWLSVARTAQTTQELRLALHTAAEDALKGERCPSTSPTTAEESAELQVRDPELEKVVTHVVLLDQAAQIEEATDSSPVSAEKAVRRIREQCRAVTADPAATSRVAA